jgi:hypothetical protein
MSRVQALNLVDFTGGLNLRADAFELAENESPDIVNVDIDPRGGFFSRKGWERWNSSDIAAVWDPRSMFVHQLANGTEYVFVANDGEVLESTNGTFSVVETSGLIPVPVAGDPHLADFAPWGDDLFIACGHGELSARWQLSGTVLMNRAETGTFTAYTAPSNDVLPGCEFMASHAGYLFAAYTSEDSTTHPHRLRWSHPNNPLAWNADDYIDIKEGGGPITGIVPRRDHLLIFKPSSVWALFGYDSSSWQLVNVTREVGAPHRQAIARSETTVFFFTWPSGVYAINDANFPVEVSPQLRPLFESAEFNTTMVSEIWLGWLKNRLWVAVPYCKNYAGNSIPAPTARTIFVFDPSLGPNGAWTAYKGCNNSALGPFGQGGFGGAIGDNRAFACAREVASVVRVDELDQAVDNLDGTSEGFLTRYLTRWVDAGWPSLKKQWRSPDLIVEEKDADYELGISVFRDYDGRSAARQRTLTVTASSPGAIWGSFDWGDGSWGAGGEGTVLERGPSFGPAASIQLLFEGEESKAWGVNGLVLKYIPRRLR